MAREDIGRLDRAAASAGVRRRLWDDLRVTTSANVTWHAGVVERTQRWESIGQRGATVWFTGLPASGKSTVAAAVEAELVRAGRAAYRLDGDNLRHGVCGDLGFTAEDRDRNVRRTAEVARLFADAGVVALVSVVSPVRGGALVRARAARARRAALHRGVRQHARSKCARNAIPRASTRVREAGQLQGFTGVDDPYEPPTRARRGVALPRRRRRRGESPRRARRHRRRHRRRVEPHAAPRRRLAWFGHGGRPSRPRRGRAAHRGPGRVAARRPPAASLARAVPRRRHGDRHGRPRLGRLRRLPARARRRDRRARADPVRGRPQRRLRRDPPGAQAGRQPRVPRHARHRGDLRASPRRGCSTSRCWRACCSARSSPRPTAPRSSRCCAAPRSSATWRARSRARPA